MCLKQADTVLNLLLGGEKRSWLTKDKVLSFALYKFAKKYKAVLFHCCRKTASTTKIDFIATSFFLILFIIGVMIIVKRRLSPTHHLHKRMMLSHSNKTKKFKIST